MIVSPVALGALILIFFNTPAGSFIQEKGYRLFLLCTESSLPNSSLL